jgi:PAS domain S-box-containing protein
MNLNRQSSRHDAPPVSSPMPPLTAPPNLQIDNVFEKISDAVMALDTTWRCTYVNEKAAQIFNRKRNDLIGKRIWTEFPEDVGQPYYHAYHQAVETQQPVYLEEYYPAYARWYENRIYPSESGLVIFFTDITDRKLTESRLRASEERLEHVVETISEAILILDQNGSITFANAPAEKILGLPRSEIINRSHNDPLWQIAAVDGEAIPDEEMPFVQVMTSGQSVKDVELTVLKPDGSRILLSVNATPLVGAWGKPTGLVVSITDVTGRRLAEEQEKQTTDFSNALLDSLPGVFYYYDENLKFLRWNRNLEKVSGYTAEELVKMGPLDFFPEGERKRVSERIRDVFTSGHSQVEAYFEAKDGSQVPYYFTGIRAYTGDKPRLIGVGIDISAHRRAEEALRASEERYRLISGIVSDYVFSTQVEEDGALRLNWVAGAFEAITGYTFEDYRARGGWTAAIYPDDLEIDARDLQKIRQNQAAISTVRTVKKDGTLVWCQVYAHPVWDAEKQRLIGIYGAVQDITERKRAEEIVAASQKQLSLIFETVTDSLFLLTVEPGEVYRFASVNPVFLTSTGLKFTQVVGRRVEEVFPEAVTELVRTKYRQAILEKTAISWEEASSYPTGTLYGKVTVTPAFDAAGVCTHLIGSVHDITQIRQAEQEIRKLNQELEQRVAERTAQLQIANKDLESFSYSVSHDLRAPLRAISGFAQIIARRHRSSLNEEGQHYFDNIVQASERMGYLIDDLLQYSRLGRQSVQLRPVKLSAVLGALAKDFDVRLKEAGGTLEIAIDLPVVLADKTLLRQIFTNLLDNAITYRRPQVPVHISVTWQAEDHAAVICVRDNGVGIPKEHHEKIFNVFQRLQSDDVYPGTGIGLATVKKSVEMLGASVRVESQVGQGSAFYIRLAQE